MSETSAFMTEVELANRQKRSIRTLQADRLKGGGIPYVKIGRSVRYRTDDVLAWEEAHRVSSTSQADALSGGKNGQ